MLGYGAEMRLLCLDFRRNSIHKQTYAFCIGIDLLH
jgi:hypothetical protein